MAMPNKRPTKPPHSSNITPLGIIAAFVALSETVAGLAAVKTEGAVQLIFAIFAALFPVLIAALFFAVLWKRSYVLYPPKEFGRDVDVTRYVEAMRHQAISSQELIALVRTSINETFTSQEAQAALAQVTTENTVTNRSALERASETLAEKTVDRIEESILRVDISRFGYSVDSPVPELIFSYDPNEDVFSLLSAIYYQISDYVPAFTYGKSWALQDAFSNQLILPATIPWVDNYALAASEATVQEFGLQPGMRLRAVLLPQSL
jgi:hypothetical protein